MTEFELIGRFFTRHAGTAEVGNGDDAAVIAPAAGQSFAVTTDTLVEGRHFLPTIDPYKLGQRAVQVNLSDLAAMGATPRHALLSLTLPRIDEAWVARFAEGLWLALDEYGIELIGGNTTRGPLAIALTAFGELPAGSALRRSGALVGDELWISGPTGDAGWALHCMTGEVQAEASAAQIAKYELPRARVALGVALRGLASSCIDVSDGLLSEAKHLAVASGVAIDIDFAAVVALAPELAERLSVPEHAAMARHCLLSTGDTYELLFTAASAQHDDVAALLARLGLAGACIGRVTATASAGQHDSNVRVLDAQSRPMNVDIQGWDHFA